MNRFLPILMTWVLALTSCEGLNWDDILGGVTGGNNADTPSTYEIVLDPSLLQFGSEGDEKQVAVTANVDYELLCEADWVSYRKSEIGVIVRVENNTLEQKRKALLVVCNREYEIYRSVTIEQAAYISPYTPGVTLAKIEIEWSETSVIASTMGNPNSSYAVHIVKGGDFCSVQPTVGKVGEPFFLCFTENMGQEARIAEVMVEFSDGYSQTLAVRQLSPDTDSTYNRKWAEQPEKVANEEYIHKTYYSTLMDGKRVRNFSICYDSKKMCSRWVAYPGHSVYRKWGSYKVGENNNSGRTNAWAFDDAVTQYAPSTDYNSAYEIVSKYDGKTDAYDTAKEPIIPHSRQADICYTNGFGWGWARGHMLPSSQRYNTWENNAQTCYATNIMVQQYDFNGGSWADVEELERNKNCSDTLYVVVGTLFEDSKTISRFGRTIGVPTHCYKLLLRTKSGSSGKVIGDITSADELICIGFIFENSEKSADVNIATATTSVTEIEKRAGFKFFRNLNPAIADKVKSQNKPSDWGL